MVTKIILALFMVLVASVSSAVQACSVPPVPPENAREALDRASAIGLVEVQSIRLRGGRIVVDMNVLEVFRGDSSSLAVERFPCRDCSLVDIRARQVDHQSLDFYRGAATGLGYTPGCSLVPGIEIGKTYVFVKADPTSRFVLEAVDTDDNWLRTVRGYVVSREFAPLDVHTYLRNAKSVAVKKCAEGSKPYVCEEGITHFLSVQESDHRWINYPSRDGICFEMEKEFGWHHQFALGGLDDGVHCRCKSIGSPFRRQGQ